MRRETLVDGITAGVTTDPFNVYHRQPATLAASGLATTETGDLQILINGTYTDVYDGGSQVQLTPTQNVLVVEIPGRYRIVLSATASATSIAKYNSGV
jgi:hypothetical protein